MSSSAMPRTAALAVTAAVALYSSVKLTKKWLPSFLQKKEDATEQESSVQRSPRRDKATLLVSAVISLCSSLLSGKWCRSLLKEEGANEVSNRNLILDENQTEMASSGKRRTTLDQELDLFRDGLVVKPIGVVKSIYRLCVGTPRQGLLAPHARGRIELLVESDAVLGLEGYSHLWIVFVFHLNTVSKSQNNKVAPPALGGEKVGVLATRSPHRPNPVGITLCQLDSITLPAKDCKRTYLEISGLDLVDGTPVLDVKPYVPHYDSVDSPQLPPWVSSGLATRRNVTFSAEAQEELETLLKNDPKCLEFYGPHQRDTSMETTLENIKHCIEEVLGFDVRSAWQTSKLRKGKFQAERAVRVQVVLDNGSRPQSSSDDELLCTQQLDNLLIHYAVTEPSQHIRTTSHGSGAEDSVTVKSIQLLVPGKSRELPLGASREIQVSRALPTAVLKDENPVEKATSLDSTIPDSQSESLGEAKDTLERILEAVTAPKADDDKALDVNVAEISNEGEEAVATIKALPTSIPTEEAEHASDSPTQDPLAEQVSSEGVPVEASNDRVAEGSIETSPQSKDAEEEEHAYDSTSQPEEPQKPQEPQQTGGKETEDVVPSSSETLKKQLKRPNDPVMIATDSGSNIPRPPLDSDYRSLKSYWAEAASQNTPTGLLPEQEEIFRRRQSSQKFFKFSDKPVPVHVPYKDTAAPDEQDKETHVTKDSNAASEGQGVIKNEEALDDASSKLDEVSTDEKEKETHVTDDSNTASEGQGKVKNDGALDDAAPVLDEVTTDEKEKETHVTNDSSAPSEGRGVISYDEALDDSVSKLDEVSTDEKEKETYVTNDSNAASEGQGKVENDEALDDAAPNLDEATTDEKEEETHATKDNGAASKGRSVISHDEALDDAAPKSDEVEEDDGKNTDAMIIGGADEKGDSTQADDDETLQNAAPNVAQDSSGEIPNPVEGDDTLTEETQVEIPEGSVEGKDEDNTEEAEKLEENRAEVEEKSVQDKSIKSENDPKSEAKGEDTSLKKEKSVGIKADEDAGEKKGDRADTMQDGIDAESGTERPLDPDHETAAILDAEEKSGVEKKEDISMSAEPGIDTSNVSERALTPELQGGKNIDETDVAKVNADATDNIQKQGDGTISAETVEEADTEEKTEKVEENIVADEATTREESGGKDVAENKGGRSSTANQLPAVNDSQTGQKSEAEGVEGTRDATNGTGNGKSPVLDVGQGAEDAIAGEDDMAVAQSQDSTDNVANTADESVPAKRKKKKKKRGKKKH